MENGKLEKFDWNDLNVDNIDTFPSNKDLASLALTVYYQKHGSKATYQTNEPNIESLPRSWKLIATSRGGNGYNGAAYYNVTSKHLVVAHRGTNNPGSLYVDVVGVTLGRITPHMMSAYHFTREIVEKFRECAISISVTGHSLGGWLSQMSAFFIKHPKISNDLPSSKDCGLHVDYLVESSHDPSPFNDPSSSNHLHVVTFDSPGVLDIVRSYLLKHYLKYDDDRSHIDRYIDDLDITTYISSPNIVNVVNMHIGSLFIMRNIGTHGIKTIVQFWQSTEYVDKNLLKITDWSSGLASGVKEFFKSFVSNDKTALNTKISAEPFDVRSFRMSIFESDEREFLKDIHNLKELGIIEDKMSWATIYENIQTDEIIRTANDIFSKIYNYTQAKDIFGFFDSFKIDENLQVLTLTNDGFKVQFFIRLVKHFVRNSNFNLPAVVKEVIKNFPKYYRAFHRDYIFKNRIGEVRTGDIPSLNKFLESDKFWVFQAIAAESTLDCVEKMFSLLKSKRFSFRGNGNETLDMKYTLFLNTDLLTDLDRYVGIKKITPPSDDLKLIVVENSYESMQPALKSLILKATSPSLKVIVVTKHKISIPIENCPFYLEKKMEPSDQSILFDHLTIEQQADVFETKICFQGDYIRLKNLISLEELRLSKADILSETTLRAFRRSSPSNTVSFGGTLNTLDEFERSYYIHRHFHKIILTDPSQFLNYENSHEKTSNFVLIVSYRQIDARNQILSSVGASRPVFEWEGNFDGFNRMVHKLILVESTIHRPNYNHFKSHFKEVALTAAWLVYDAKKWYWHSSFGALDLGHFNFRYEERCSEQELLEIQQQLVIICDEPGMGKSTLLKNISEECKKERRKDGKSSWVIFVTLNNHLDLLRKLKESGDLVSVANFLFQIDDSSPSVGKSILEKCLHIEERVKIFFDGFDEIDDVIQSKVKDIVMTLLDQTKAKIFLSSRIHMRYTLQKTFSCYSNRFLPLDNDEKVDFLTKFWTEHSQLQKHGKNTISMNDSIEKYAHQLLKELRHSLNFEDIDKFIGVPLQLFMLGTVSLPRVSSFLSDVESNAGRDTYSIIQQNIELFDNVFHLFQMFVKEKFHISMNEKLKLKQLAEDSPWLYDNNLTCLTKAHCAISFRYLYPKEFQEFIGSVKSKHRLNEKNYRTIHSVGIVQNVSTDLSSIQFIHRSLAEYFAADFLVSRLAKVHCQKKVVEFLKRNYFHPQFEKIRFFVDHFISIQPGCDPIFQKCLNFEEEKQNIFTMLKENKNKYCYDLLGRNVLHYAISYGDCFTGNFWCLMQNWHLFYEEDVFGCSFLSYFVLLNGSMELYVDDGFLSIYWILLIPEVFDLTGPHSATIIIEQLKCSDIRLFENRMTDLKQISGISLFDRRIDIFFNIIVKYWNCTTTFLNTFELAVMTNSDAHVEIVFFLFNTAFQNDVMRNEILSLMTKDGCALFKYYVKNEKYFSIEPYLWKYCNEQGKKKEMDDFVKTTNLLTFRCLCASRDHFDYTLEPRTLILYYMEFYENLKDDSLRKKMSDIAQNIINEIFDVDLPETENDKYYVEACRKNSTYEKWDMISLRRNHARTFCDMLCFLRKEDRERALEKHFEAIRLYITRGTESIKENAEYFIDRILYKTVSREIEARYRELLKTVDANSRQNKGESFMEFLRSNNFSISQERVVGWRNLKF